MLSFAKCGYELLRREYINFLTEKTIWEVTFMALPFGGEATRTEVHLPRLMKIYTEQRLRSHITVYLWYYSLMQLNFDIRWRALICGLICDSYCDSYCWTRSENWKRTIVRGPKCLEPCGGIAIWEKFQTNTVNFYEVTPNHSWKKAGSRDPGSHDFFGQN